jgi:hypothetical protein
VTSGPRCALLAAVALAGCGGGSGSPRPEPNIDADAFARCIVNRTSAVPDDPLLMHLSPALRAAASQGERVRGSVMPRPHGFALFAGADRTFVPAGFGSSTFVPAAFVAFPDTAAAKDHAGDADARAGNLLIVYDGRPPRGETSLVAGCLRKVGA